MGRNILLAWEGGAGRGHLVTLRILAEAIGPENRFEAALALMDHASELQPVCRQVYPGARLRLSLKARRDTGNPVTATLGEYLGDSGFARPGELKTLLEWWIGLILSRRYDLVIGDLAPVSMLAAYALGIPYVCVGTGYFVPPAGMETFPTLSPKYDRRIYAESDLLANVNAILEPHGAAPLARLSDIYAAAHALPRTIAALDPYVDQRRDQYLPPLNRSVLPAREKGDEVFCYFSTDEQNDPELIAALERLNLPCRGYFPGMAGDVKARLSRAGIIIEPEPLPHALIAQRSRMIIHGGQHGSLCMGLGLGLPQLALPQFQEQLIHSRRAEALGTVRLAPRRHWDAQKIGDTIRDLYESPETGEAALSLADHLRPSLFGDTSSIVRARLAHLLG